MGKSSFLIIACMGIIAVAFAMLGKPSSAPQTRPATVQELQARYNLERQKRDGKIACLQKVTAAMKGIVVDPVVQQRIVWDTCGR